MSKSHNKIYIPLRGSAKVIHAADTSGSAHGSTNPYGEVPKVVVKVQANYSPSKRRKTRSKKGGKYHHKKHTMRRSKKLRKQTKKKGKKHRKSSKKSRKTRK